MRPLSDTIARLAAFRAAATRTTSAFDHLAELTDFGTNPGNLRARVHVPTDLPKSAPLVVVLHGCTQTAGEYDLGSGWSQLADSQGFAVLLPEQQRANNPNLCFNWFVPGDTRRDLGEAQSIREMIEKMVTELGLDRSRIFITGLSAGGAMASVMLATYPEVFAGGAIVAGLPYGVASTVPEAFDSMRGHGGLDAGSLEALVRGASRHAGPWPTISIWHGSADNTVSPSNGEAILDQWRGLHGVGLRPARSEVVDGYPHEVWCDRQGRAVIERYTITGMSHGTPLDVTNGDGVSGAYMLDVGISSTRHIARFWGLAPAGEFRRSRKPAAAREAAPEPVADPVGPITQVIETALRRAGLMR